MAAVPGTALVLTVFAGWVWAAHTLWPLLPAGSIACLPPRRATRWSVVFAITAALAQSAAWMANTDRLLLMGGALSSPAARFALVASVGLVAADFVVAWSCRQGGSPTRGTALLQATLGAAALLGFFWALESARLWRPVTVEAMAPAVSLGLAALSLVRPADRAPWLALLAPLGGVTWVAQLPDEIRQRLLTTMALAPFLGGLLLVTSESLLPRRLRGLARAVGSLLLLVVLAMVFVSTTPTS
jgi:hypothetical protein